MAFDEIVQSVCQHQESRRRRLMLYSAALFILGFVMMGVVVWLMSRGELPETGGELGTVVAACILPLTIGLRMHAGLERREAWLARLKLAANQGDPEKVDQILSNSPSNAFVEGLMSGMKTLKGEA